MEESGEDAYARRIRLSQMHQHPPPSAESPPPPPPPPPPERAGALNPAVSALAAMNATISRAPVRYSLPPAPAELPSSEAELEKALEEETDNDVPPASEQNDEDDGDEEAPRSSRPGQSGFAQRLMAKYGWTKGSGLGAQGTGITSALRVQVEKRKQRSDADGGGFVDRGGKGKIIGGKKKGGDDDEGKFGAMSEVVVLKGMLGGMDVEAEMQGGLVQEIGEECGEKYGRVERVYVWRDADNGPEGPPVFIKFTSQLSGLRVSDL
jgi:splicing factor 45